MLTQESILEELRLAGIDLADLGLDTIQLDEPEADNKPFRNNGPLFNKMADIVTNVVGDETLKDAGDTILCNIKLTAMQALCLAQFISICEDRIVPSAYQGVEDVVMSIMTGIEQGIAAYRFKQEKTI